MTNDHQPLLRHPTRRQFLKLAASTTLSSTLLSGCGWTLAEVQESSETACGRTLADVKPKTKVQESSKVLYIYTWANYTDRDLLDRFRAETGIKVVADVFDSNEVMLARLQAGGGGTYSIIYPSDYMVQKMVDLCLLRELDHSRIAGLQGLIPQFQNPGYDQANRHSVPLSWGTTGLIYNSQKLKEAPQDWSYLWESQQPQLSELKRITLLNDVREVMGTGLKMLGYSYNSTNPEQVQQAYEKLAQLKPRVASFTSDAWRPQMLSGDLLIAMCFSSDASEIMEENENLQYVLPKSGSSLWTDTLAIPITAPNIEGAYAWINFMLQPDVAAQICERLSFATPNQLAIDQLSEKVRNNQSLFPPDSSLKLCESIAPIGKMEEIYDEYWTKLLII
jgi:spermidine/putrescine transport system substrate-binding protein